MDSSHPWLRRNILLLTIDFVAFSLGFSFFDPLVIVPAFTQAVSGSAFAVGALSAVRILFVTLPQLWAAHMLSSSARKKPLLLWSSVGGRLPVLLLALATWWFTSTAPWLVLGVLAITIALFYTSEGLNAISWPDIVGKLIPARIRGRFLGLGQLLSSLSALGAGYLIRRVFAGSGQTSQSDWALLFACASAGLFASVLAIALLRERAVPVAAGSVDLKHSLRQLRLYLRTDLRLRRIVLIEVLLGIASSVFPFFVLRAQALVTDGNAILGSLVIAQNLGGMAAAAICGQIIDRKGSWVAVRLTTCIVTAALALAAIAPMLETSALVFLGAFTLLGFVTGSSWWIFTAYLMDIADDTQRPSYLAASGVLKSPVFLASLIAGAGYRAFSPGAVFGVALLFAVSALLASFALPHTPSGARSDAAQLDR